MGIREYSGQSSIKPYKQVTKPKMKGRKHVRNSRNRRKTVSTRRRSLR
mgnify:CR=1 FL=1